MNQPLLSSQGMDALSRFICDLVNLVKMIELYTASHPLSREAADQVHKSLLEALVWRNEIHITCGKEILVNEKSLEEMKIKRNPAHDRFRSILGEKKVSSLILDQFVTQDELTRLATLLATAAALFDTRDLASVLRDESIFSIRVNELPGAPAAAPESLLLTHFIDGSLGNSLAGDVRKRLFTEFRERSHTAGRQVLDRLLEESADSFPLISRDLLVNLGEKWIHFAGDMIQSILNGLEPAEQNRRAVELLEILTPGILTIPGNRLGQAEDAFLHELSDLEPIDRIHRFEGFYHKLDARLKEAEPFFNRVKSWVQTIVDEGNRETFDIQSALDEFSSFCNRMLYSSSLTEKVLSAIFRLSERRFVHDLLGLILAGMAELKDPHPDTIAAVQGRLIGYFSSQLEACTHLMIPLVQTMFRARSEKVSDSLFDVIGTAIKLFYYRNEKLSEVPIIELTASILQKDVADIGRFRKLIAIWREASFSLIKKDPQTFRRKVINMVQYPLNPGDFRDSRKQKLVEDAWKSFAEATIFQETFKLMIGDDRDVRFRTMRRLSRYGTFATWVCLGALNNQNWHLRRNLAKVMGMAADLDYASPLLEPLRDQDWRVRLEMIGALAERIPEIENTLKKNADHPVVKILCTALRDGNPKIRQAAYNPIREYNLQAAVKSLKNLYDRLAAVNSDSDIEERVQIIGLLADLASSPDADKKSIVELIAEIAAQKEGLITPHRMIPLKKAAAEALASISHPSALEWLEILASEKPHKRGIIGREARFYLRELKRS